ncbi:MAG TPA: hypothetical protein VF608_04835 [Thermoanaerobaculia bacterium]
MNIEEVAELRKGDRFIFNQPPTGTFGPVDISVIDVGVSGAKMQHGQALRIGTVARLAFRIGEIVVSTQGKVIWSHFLQTSNGLVYRSGIRIQPDPVYAAAVNAFYKSGAVKREMDSLDRKKQRLIDRENARKSAVRSIPTAGGIN